MTKLQVLKIRENADKLLKRMEEKENDELKKLTLSYTNLKSDIGSILSKLSSTQSEDKILGSLQVVLQRLEQAITANKSDNSDVVKSLGELQLVIGALRTPDFGKDVVEAVKKLEKSLKLLQKPTVDRTDELINTIKGLKFEAPPIEFPDTVNIGNFPPQKTPQPTTHFSINSLNGFVHTTSATVNSTLTTLPSYGVLENRRSILIYNNSSNTIYIGGSDITASNGMPIPANSYSPILDCGKNMILYGIASTGENNVRCLEVSDEASGR